MIRHATVLALALCPAALFSQDDYAAEAPLDLVVHGPDAPVPVDKLTRLRLDLPEGATAAWTAHRDKGGRGDGVVSDNGKLFAFCGPAGTYDIDVFVLVEERLVQLTYVTERTGGAVPDPPPVVPGPVDPPPVDPPPVPPRPLAGPYFVFILRESSVQQDPRLVAIVNDEALWDKLKTAGHDHRVVDPDEKDESARSVVKVNQELGEGKLPSLVITTMKGELVTVDGVPATSEELWRLIDGLSRSNRRTR